MLTDGSSREEILTQRKRIGCSPGNTGNAIGPDALIYSSVAVGIFVHVNWALRLVKSHLSAVFL